MVFNWVFKTAGSLAMLASATPGIRYLFPQRRSPEQQPEPAADRTKMGSLQSDFSVYDPNF
jgi:hypothetical protein